MTEPRDREAHGANDDDASRGLDAAVVAARRAFDGESGLTAATERRILEASRRRRRVRPATWLVPLAAAFVASAAVAHGFGAFGGLRARVFGDALPAPSVTTSVAPSGSSPPRGPAKATETARPFVEPALQDPPPAAATALDPIAPARPAPPASDLKAQAAAPAASLLPPTDAAKLDEMALYREAHRAHFSERNFALALSRWDRYLALSPRGTFVLEARYNRGVALYRLGRREAAAEALRPFAEGVYGGYRSSEAARMLEELR